MFIQDFTKVFIQRDRERKSEQESAIYIDACLTVYFLKY